MTQFEHAFVGRKVMNYRGQIGFVAADIGNGDFRLQFEHCSIFKIAKEVRRMIEAYEENTRENIQKE
jgi:predicted ArsR family transcriptional regulator